MSTILNKSSLNFLLQHPWQLALAIVGIALGVAVVISIDLAMESSLTAFDQAGKAFSGTATHRIIASEGGLDEKLYTQLRVGQGIKKLSPVVSGYVQLAKQTNNSFKLIGIDPFIEKSFKPVWQQEQSKNQRAALLARLVVEPNTVLISDKTARSLHLKINDEFTIVSDSGKQDLKIIGFLQANNAISEQVLAKLIITDIATAQEVLGLFGRLSSIEVLMDNYEPETLTKILKLLPGSALFVSVDSQSQSMREMTRAFSINLKALGLLSLLVGMFLIYNTMTFLVMQRRRLIGCLRSIGITRRQIFKLIIGEAFLLAIIGTLIGIALGIALGQSLLYMVSETINAIYFRVDATSLIIRPAQIGKGVFLGIAATLVAVLPPAWEATRFPPATVLIRSGLESSTRQLVSGAKLTGFILIAGGLALALSSAQSVSWGLAGIFIIVFGFALLTPAFTLGLVQMTDKLFGRFLGIAGRLPVRTISSEISRTGIAVAALMIAVSATIGMELMIGSLRQTVTEWVQASLAADLYVTLPGEKIIGGRAIEEHQLKKRLADLPDVQMLSSALHTKLIANDEFTKVSVFELNPQSRKGFIFKDKVNDDLWDRFEQQQTVMVTEPYAYYHAIRIGQEILLQTDKGKQPFEVIAVYADYSGDQGHLSMSRQNYQRYWPDLGYSGIGVYARKHTDLKQLENQLYKLLTGQQSVKSDKDIYKASMEVFEQTFTVTETLRWLSAAVAFVGVLSTLMALQFERTRQLGILRAIGLTRRQLTFLVIGETGLMGLIAGLFAIPVGYVVAYVLIFVVYERSFGWTMAFHFDPMVVYQGLALAFIAAVLAGIFPALKMARIKPAEALRIE
ncbi:putative ABC transport system permease protein [Candidatus Methylobacter favarea]|uniref:Putative ABC transport system permease protein n=1 Tax=Candidatus Methylobacter favarea TaxID=2707345 RepID=A0A8S0WLX0_9GAMM|nr:ABC transporter permease [Candidatus Methylobacter favarea]CAA9889410.1 putative ABC transport system permease protein [Candidatus Methylobacter favarea]